MPRKAREISPTGMYHIHSRGNGQQNIFECENDYKAFLKKLYYVKKDFNLEIHAYCLMPNHFHLLVVQSDLKIISTAMHRLLTNYAMRFNIVYNRSGVLFGNRYSSVPLVNYNHYINLIKYIHYNPVKAEICFQPSDYPWSSFSEILLSKRAGLIDRDITLKMYHTDFDQARIFFLKHHESKNVLPDFLFDTNQLSLERKIYLLEHVFNDLDVKNIASLNTEFRNQKIIEMRKELKLSISQIQRLTGVSKVIVKKVCSKVK